MGESIAQDLMTEHLRKIFEWQFQVQGWLISRNLNLYQTNRKKEKPLAPDLAIFIGVVYQKKKHLDLRSWRVGGPKFPPPRVVFEIVSDKQWEKDVETKPEQYARMGVSELFTFDPRIFSPSGRQTHTGAGPVRLRGWKLKGEQVQEITANEEGWLWSEALESWLAPVGQELEVYAANKVRRINAKEAAALEKAAKEQALAAAKAEKADKERAWSKLREQGIDPESL